MHPLDEDSPLHGWSEEDFARSDATLVIIFSGHDENSNQLVRGRRLYSMQDVLLDHDYVDLQRTDPDGMTFSISANSTGRVRSDRAPSRFDFRAALP